MQAFLRWLKHKLIRSTAFVQWSLTLLIKLAWHIFIAMGRIEYTETAPALRTARTVEHCTDRPRHLQTKPLASANRQDRKPDRCPAPEPSAKQFCLVYYYNAASCFSKNRATFQQVSTATRTRDSPFPQVIHGGSILISINLTLFREDVREPPRVHVYLSFGRLLYLLLRVECERIPFYYSFFLMWVPSIL